LVAVVLVAVDLTKDLQMKQLLEVVVLLLIVIAPIQALEMRVLHIPEMEVVMEDVVAV
jgi:hypothetical protein